MMDVVTGKTRPDEGQAFFAGDIDLLKHNEPEIANYGIGRKFQKPTVFAQSHGPREPRAGRFARQARMAHARGQNRCRAARAHGLHARRDRPVRRSDPRRGGVVARSKAMARDRHAAHAEPAPAARRRAGGRHDPSKRPRRTAELLLSLAGEHSVVVVEHDMEFVRSIARKCHRAARGPRPRRGDRWIKSKTTRTWSRSTWVNRPTMLHSHESQSIVRPKPHALGHQLRRAARLVRKPDRPQRRG